MENESARKDAVFALIVIVAVIAAVYSATYLFSYAFFDDYRYVYRSSHVHSMDIITDQAVNGRPIANFVTAIGYSLAKQIPNLRFLRLVSLAGISCLAFTLYLALRRKGIEQGLALVCSTLFCLLPSNVVIANWAALMCAPWAAVLSYIAYVRLERSESSVGARAQALVTAWGVLFLASLIYQPYVLFYLVFFAIQYWPVYTLDAKLFRRVGLHVSSLSVPLVMTFAFNQRFASGTRGGANFNLIEKFVWFVKEPLTNSLSLYVLNSTDGNLRVLQGVAAAAALTFVVLTMMLRMPLRYRLFNLFAATCLLVAGHAPFLAIAESWAAYRTILVMATMFLCFLGIALDPIYRKANSTVRLAPVVAVALVLPLGLVAAHRTAKWFVRPHIMEYSLLKTEISQGLTQGASHYFLLMADWQDSAANGAGAYDDFGNPGTYNTWNAEPMFWLAMEDVLTMRGGEGVQAELAIGREKPEGDSYVLDMTRLRQIRL